MKTQSFTETKAFYAGIRLMSVPTFTDTKARYAGIRRELAMSMGNRTLTDIANQFKVSPRTVTRAVREDKACPKNNFYPLPTVDVGADLFFEGMQQHIDELKDVKFSAKEKSIFLVMCNELKSKREHDLLPELIAMMKKN